MTSFLGVPIKLRDEVYGNLYLTDKIGWSEFTSDDDALVGALSLAAGIAIENARLHERVRAGPPSTRTATAWPGTCTTRSSSACSPWASRCRAWPPACPRPRRASLSGAVAEIDRIITQVRSTIYELGMGDESRGIRDDITFLVRELDAVVGFEAELTFEGPVDSVLTGPVLEHLLAALREALTNVGRHARASRASVCVAVDDTFCRLVISDNGIGIPDTAKADGTGHGLPNLRRRAEKLHGTFTIEDHPDGGTVLAWIVPLGI